VLVKNVKKSEKRLTFFLRHPEQRNDCGMCYREVGIADKESVSDTAPRLQQRRILGAPLEGDTTRCQEPNGDRYKHAAHLRFSLWLHWFCIIRKQQRRQKFTH